MLFNFFSVLFLNLIPALFFREIVYVSNFVLVLRSLIHMLFLKLTCPALFFLIVLFKWKVFKFVHYISCVFYVNEKYGTMSRIL